MDRDVPVREQAIIYLVNQLRQAFCDYRDAISYNQREQAYQAFMKASDQLDYFGIHRDPPPSASR